MGIIGKCLVAVGGMALPFTFFLSLGCSEPEEKPRFVQANNPNIRITGRYLFDQDSVLNFDWSGVSIEAYFESSYIKVKLKAPKNYFNIFIDGKKVKVLNLEKKSKDSLHILAKNLKPGPHSVKIYKRTEAHIGLAKFYGFELEPNGKVFPMANPPERKIEIIGNSVVCGYGNMDSTKSHKFKKSTQDSYHTFGAILARKFNAEAHIICCSGKGILENYDVKDKKPMPIMYRRAAFNIDKGWNFQNWIPEAVVVSLGSNDFVRGPPDSAKFVNAYAEFLVSLNKNYPNAEFFILDGPMMSNDYPIDSASGEPYPTSDIFQRYLNGLIKRLYQKNFENIHYYSLTPNHYKVGYGAEWHPNVLQHQINGTELSNYISGIMGWN